VKTEIISDRSKLGQAKRHILTDKNGIPISVIVTSANPQDLKAVIDVINNIVGLKRHSESSFTKKKRRNYHHLCLDRAYNSKTIKQRR